MPALTRRRYPDRPDCWHVYYGEVRVGTMNGCLTLTGKIRIGDGGSWRGIGKKTGYDMKKIRVFVLAVVLGSIPSAPNAFAADLAGSSGTLILGIPNADGLVIAADSRRTLNGLACDFGTKLFVPTNMPSTVFGFTGLSSY